MTIPRYQDISRYQRDNPPLHMMVAAYLGAGKDSGQGSTPALSSGLDEQGQSLFDLFPQSPR